MARIHEELYKNGLYDPNNHDVVTHLKLDILECDVKLALGSIAMSKGSGSGIPAEVFQILKDDAVEVLPSICPQNWETKQDWKRSVSLQSKRRVMAKNVQTTVELQSFHVLARLCLKSFNVCFSSI